MKQSMPSSPSGGRIPSVSFRIAKMCMEDQTGRFQRLSAPAGPPQQFDGFHKLDLLLLRDRLRQIVRPNDVLIGTLCSKVDSEIEIQVHHVVRFHEQMPRNLSLGAKASDINLRARCRSFELTYTCLSSLSLGTWLRAVVVSVDRLKDCIDCSLKSDRLNAMHIDNLIELGICTAPEYNEEHIVHIRAAIRPQGSIEEQIQEHPFFRNPNGMRLVIKHLGIEEYGSLLHENN